MSPTTSADRRRQILDATVALASEGGFDAVQMRTVAERAAVALGTLYRYFPSKVHLLVAALERELARADADLAEHPAAGGTAADRVVDVVRRAGGGLREDRLLAEALVRAFMFADDSVGETTRAVGTLVTGMLLRAMRPGADPRPDDVTAARVVADVWLATLVGWVTGRTGVDAAAAHLEAAVRLVVRDLS